MYGLMGNSAIETSWFWGLTGIIRIAQRRGVGGFSRAKAGEILGICEERN